MLFWNATYSLGKLYGELFMLAVIRTYSWFSSDDALCVGCFGCSARKKLISLLLVSASIYRCFIMSFVGGFLFLYHGIEMREMGRHQSAHKSLHDSELSDSGSIHSHLSLRAFDGYIDRAKVGLATMIS